MSEINIPDAALKENTSQRLPCVLVLDGSASMRGTPGSTSEPPIKELNAGLQLFEQDLKNDDVASLRVQLLVIRFGDDNNVEILSDWRDAGDFSAPEIKADGLSPLGAAVRLALAKIEEQKARYRAHGTAFNRPWLFVLTDGEPTDSDWEKAAIECHKAEEAEKVAFYGIGVGKANMENLSRFSIRPPYRLQGVKFRELFLFLSESAKGGAKAAQGTDVQLSFPDRLGC